MEINLCLTRNATQIICPGCNGAPKTMQTKFNRKTVMGLGITQIIIRLICFHSFITLIGKHQLHVSPFWVNEFGLGVTGFYYSKQKLFKIIAWFYYGFKLLIAKCACERELQADNDFGVQIFLFIQIMNYTNKSYHRIKITKWLLIERTRSRRISNTSLRWRSK